MAEQNGLSNKELLLEVRGKVDTILEKVNKFEEWKTDNVNPRLQSYGKRIRFIEIVFGGGISVSVIVYIIKTLIMG